MKISFFYRDIGNIPGAVAQRGNYFLEAIAGFSSENRPNLFVFCVNFKPSNPQFSFEFKMVKSIGSKNKSNFLVRIIAELLVGFQIGFKSIFIKSDLFIISTPPYLSGLLIALFQIMMRRSFALDIRDLYPRAYLDIKIISENGVLHKFFNKLNQYIFSKAAFVVCATQGQLSEISSISPKLDATTIYNGFPSRLLKIRREPRGNFKVVTHGTLGLYQNLNFILELANNLKNENIEFVVIGDGTKAKLIDPLRYVNVTFLGELSYEDVIHEVARCDLGICIRDNTIQSKYSFPVKAWEYIGLRMPLLVYPKCEVSNVFPELDGLYTFQKLEVEAFRKVILNLKHKKMTGECSLILKELDLIEQYTRETLSFKFAEIVYKNVV